MSRPPGAASCVDMSVCSEATPSTFACSVAKRLSRNSLRTNSQDEDAIARSASLERAEPAPGSQMLDDGDGDGGGDDGDGDGDGHGDGEMMV